MGKLEPTIDQSVFRMPIRQHFHQHLRCGLSTAQDQLDQLWRHVQNSPPNVAVSEHNRRDPTTLRLFHIGV